MLARHVCSPVVTMTIIINHLCLCVLVFSHSEAPVLRVSSGVGTARPLASQLLPLSLWTHSLPVSLPLWLPPLRVPPSPETDYSIKAPAAWRRKFFEMPDLLFPSFCPSACGHIAFPSLCHCGSNPCAYRLPRTGCLTDHPILAPAEWRRNHRKTLNLLFPSLCCKIIASPTKT